MEVFYQEMDTADYRKCDRVKMRRIIERAVKVKGGLVARACACRTESLWFDLRPGQTLLIYICLT